MNKHVSIIILQDSYKQTTLNVSVNNILFFSTHAVSLLICKVFSWVVCNSVTLLWIKSACSLISHSFHRFLISFFTPVSECINSFPIACLFYWRLKTYRKYLYFVLCYIIEINCLHQHFSHISRSSAQLSNLIGDFLFVIMASC